MKYILLGSFLLFVLHTKSQDFSDFEFGTDDQLEIATWNIEWFPKNTETSSNYVAQIIEAIDVDILALQEIDDTNVFREMMNTLPDYSWLKTEGWFNGLTYIYKTNSIEILDIYSIFNTQAYWHIFPRAPLVVEFTFNGMEYAIINNHLKCCGNGTLDLEDSDDEETRRYHACEFLKLYMDKNMKDDKVFVVGDMNDILTDTEANNVFQMFFDDPENYRFADMEIAESSNLDWSYPSWPSHLDHILISNELFEAFEHANTTVTTLKVDKGFENGWADYDSNVSDHRPVALSIPNIAPTKVNENLLYNAISLYPLPANNQINIDINKNIDCKEIVITDFKGAVIHVIRTSNSSKTITLNTSNLSSGIYFVTISTKNGHRSTSKFVISH